MVERGQVVGWGGVVANVIAGDRWICDGGCTVDECGWDEWDRRKTVQRVGLTAAGRYAALSASDIPPLKVRCRVPFLCLPHFHYSKSAWRLGTVQGETTTGGEFVYNFSLKAPATIVDVRGTNVQLRYHNIDNVEGQYSATTAVQRPFQKISVPFFVHSLIVCDLSRSWRCTHFPGSCPLSRPKAARCSSPLPSAQT